MTGEEERCPFPPSCPLELLPFRWLQCWLRRSASTSVITITIYSGFLVVRAGGEIGDVALPMLQLVDLKKEREREWHHDLFPSGLQWFAVTRFRNFPDVYLYAKEASRIFCLDYGGEEDMSY